MTRREFLMQGDLRAPNGQLLQRAGFMLPGLGPTGMELGPSMPLYTRAAVDQDLLKRADEINQRLQRVDPSQVQRAEVIGDVTQILMQLGTTMADFQRAITSTMTAFPVRENLEAEARILIPLDTPLRNKLPRRPGAGRASAWKQLTSLGGGWATGLDQGGSAAALRMFFAESGAPAEHTSVYADKSAGYKLLGTYGAVTGFAMAAGANFQNQLAIEKRNAIMNLKLNEEYALTAGDSTSAAAPWGDGTSPLAFDGLVNLITTANGTPAAQVQTTVGALTIAHIDAQLRRLWNQGGRGLYMLANGVEVASMVHLAEASGSIIRVQATSDGKTVLGVTITGYVHPVTGELVDVLPSRFLSAGTLLFGSSSLPDGTPAADVEVLPQVQLPELAPNDNVEGYTAQELAPTTAAPQVYPFIVSVYEVLRMKSALHFAKSTGVTAV